VLLIPEMHKTPNHLICSFRIRRSSLSPLSALLAPHIFDRLLAGGRIFKAMTRAAGQRCSFHNPESLISLFLSEVKGLQYVTRRGRF
jgi:hypothetical protein